MQSQANETLAVDAKVERPQIWYLNPAILFACDMALSQIILMELILQPAVTYHQSFPSCIVNKLHDPWLL